MSTLFPLPAALAVALETIDPARMLAYTQILSSPDFAGRRVGTDGHARATTFLQEAFHQCGWEVSTQQFALTTPVMDLIAPLRLEQLAASGSVLRAFAHRTEFCEHPRSASALEAREGSVVLLADQAARAGAWVVLDTAPSRADFTRLAVQLAQQGAQGILIPLAADTEGYLVKRIIGVFPSALPVLAVRADLLPTLVGTRIRAQIPLAFHTPQGCNVLAHLAGRGALSAHAPLLIGAHYDAMGDDPGGYRFPGATDNAAAVAVLLELARSLVSAPVHPQRPVLLVAFDAEEVGARGSYALALHFKAQAKRPFLLNLDGAACQNESVWIEPGAQSEQLLEALEQAGRWLDIPLAEGDIASDQRSFLHEGFAALGLSVGAARLHTPSDTMEQVQPAALAVAARLLLATAWQLALS